LLVPKNLTSEKRTRELPSTCKEILERLASSRPSIALLYDLYTSKSFFGYEEILHASGESTNDGDSMLRCSQIKLDLQKFIRVRIVSLLSIIAGFVMFVGGLLLVYVDLNVAESDALRNTALSSVQTFEQIIGFPLPMYEFANNSISAIGIATCIVGVDLLILSLGLMVRSMIAKWIATIIFTLATFFDFALFLLQGLLGAPAALPGTIINGLIVYVLLKDRKWFTEESKANQQPQRRENNLKMHTT